jgi:hypothetical protein
MLAEVTYISEVPLAMRVVVGLILLVIVAILYWRSGGRK